MKKLQQTNIEEFSNLSLNYGITVGDTKSESKETAEETREETNDKQVEDKKNADFPTPEIPAPKKLPTKNPPLKKHAPKMTELSNGLNHIGDMVKVGLPNGLYFVTTWVESKLDPNILQILISDDGRQVIKKKKVVSIEDPQDFLLNVLGYGWASDANNYVVRHFISEIRELQEMRSKDEWEEEPILQLDEDILPYMVDINGVECHELDYTIDSMGRQLVSFFLKSVKADKVGPKPVTFRKKGDNMNVDDVSMGVSSMGHSGASLHGGGSNVREDMRSIFGAFANGLQNETSTMKRELAEQNQKIREEVRNDMKSMVELFTTMLTAAQNHQSNPAPDPAFSSMPAASPKPPAVPNLNHAPQGTNLKQPPVYYQTPPAAQSPGQYHVATPQASPHDLYPVNAAAYAQGNSSEHEAAASILGLQVPQTPNGGSVDGASFRSNISMASSEL